MSHISCQSERDENAKINNCPYSSVKVYVKQYNDWTGEYESHWITKNQCGNWTHLSAAKDRCQRCGKIFTY